MKCDDKFLGRVWNNLAVCYTRIFQFGKAMDAFEKAFLRLKQEKILESISENLESERISQNEGLRALSSYDGDGFRREANQMIRELKKMPGLVKKYEKEG